MKIWGSQRFSCLDHLPLDSCICLIVDSSGPNTQCDHRGRTHSLCSQCLPLGIAVEGAIVIQSILCARFSPTSFWSVCILPFHCFSFVAFPLVRYFHERGFGRDIYIGKKKTRELRSKSRGNFDRFPRGMRARWCSIWRRIQRAQRL
jgi:hypothetical protein